MKLTLKHAQMKKNNRYQIEENRSHELIETTKNNKNDILPK